MSDRAVSFTAYKTAELVPWARPDRPLGPREVAGRTLASLISPGTELNWGFLGEGFPFFPGYASVFEVEEVGAEVTDLQPGDLAFCSGRHVSYQRDNRDNLVPVPEGLPAEQAVFARLMGVTMSTLVTTTARPPGLVMVTGLGIVGHLATRVFEACGYHVIGVDPSEDRRHRAEANGLARVYPEVPAEDLDIKDRVDLALDCSGREEPVLAALQVIRKGGEVVLVGTPWRQYSDASAHAVLNAVFHRYAHLRSGWEWEVPRHRQDFATGNIQANYAAALEWLATGRVSVAGLFELIRPEHCQQAYEALLQPVDKLAYVFDWRS